MNNLEKNNLNSNIVNNTKLNAKQLKIKSRRDNRHKSKSELRKQLNSFDEEVL